MPATHDSDKQTVTLLVSRRDLATARTIAANKQESRPASPRETLVAASMAPEMFRSDTGTTRTEQGGRR